MRSSISWCGDPGSHCPVFFALEKNTFDGAGFPLNNCPDRNKGPNLKTQPFSLSLSLRAMHSLTRPSCISNSSLQNMSRQYTSFLLETPTNANSSSSKNRSSLHVRFRGSTASPRPRTPIPSPRCCLGGGATYRSCPVPRWGAGQAMEPKGPTGRVG